MNVPVVYRASKQATLHPDQSVVKSLIPPFGRPFIPPPLCLWSWGILLIITRYRLAQADAEISMLEQDTEDLLEDLGAEHA